MPGYDEITKETLEQVLKSVTEQGYTTDLNLTGINLSGPALNLFPFLSPYRNRLARVMAPVGAKASQWRAITGINVTNQSIFSGYGAPGNLVSTTEQDYTAKYMPISLGDSVQMDAEALARGFDNLRAGAGTKLLYALMIKEDQADLGASNIALPTPGTPTVTAASTGGTIAATTAVNVNRPGPRRGPVGRGGRRQVHDTAAAGGRGEVAEHRAVRPEQEEGGVREVRRPVLLDRRPGPRAPRDHCLRAP